MRGFFSIRKRHFVRTVYWTMMYLFQFWTFRFKGIDGDERGQVRSPEPSLPPQSWKPITPTGHSLAKSPGGGAQVEDSLSGNGLWKWGTSWHKENGWLGSVNNGCHVLSVKGMTSVQRQIWQSWKRHKYCSCKLQTPCDMVSKHDLSVLTGLRH